MPLPSNAATAEWPPKDVAEANRAYTRWAAWWGGDVDALGRVYANALGYGDPVTPGPERRGLAGLLPRSFHGAAPAKGALRSTKLHIPLAADIATTSADLLFGEPPALVVTGDADPDKPGTKAKASPTQKRLDELMDGSLQAVLHESAELASAFGGVYLRVGWDAEIADMPLFDAIPPDAAVPEFRSGRLVAVTFHRVLRDNNNGDGNTWRHLERHEPGKIFHGLYKSGDDKHLGQLRPLTEHPETEPFAKLLAGRPYLDTGAKGLAAEYVPNMRPNRRLRGSQLGRSDLDGIEALMDALDEAWTSWMRDLRLGKGRILVPEVYLDGQGRGQGAVFDTEQEIFQQVNALPGAGGTGGLAMTIAQFNIRVQEHADTCQALTEQAVRGAGYSSQTFGITGDAAVTATEIAARERRSYGTRGKKLGYYRGPLARLCKTALEIDVKQFSTKGVVPALPDIEWPDGVAVDPQAQAQTLQLLETAKAVSTRTKVEMLHPDWDDTRIAEEVKDIDDAGMPPGGMPPAFPGSTVGKPAGPPAGPATGAQPGPPRPGGPPVPPRTQPGGAPPARPISGDDLRTLAAATKANVDRKKNR